MIKPALFVGLGTTGLKIVQGLRRLVFEEFSRPGLPIFRYVCIETDSGKSNIDAELSNTRNANENVDLIHALVPDTQAVAPKTQVGDPSYDANLTDWLNRDLLHIGTRSFRYGADNIRMAGRLCLWENWVTIQQRLQNSFNSITAPENVKETNNILNNHYGNSTEDSSNNDGSMDISSTQSSPDIYVVGSLCGGSCSGMLIDIAYFLQTLLDKSSSLCGIFSIYDLQHTTDPGNEVRAANCYAALRELNYYNHIETSYSCNFPSGHQVQEQKDPPFDYTLLVSRKAKNGTMFTNPGGAFDEDGLNQMVSLNLFADVVGGNTGQKNAIRTDWQSLNGFRALKSVVQGEIPEMIRGFASFGLTAVWYPKYRVSTASACLIGKSICKEWLDQRQDLSENQAAAKTVWDNILREHIDGLSTSPGHGSIQQEMNKLLSEANSQFRNATTSNVLKEMVDRFPEREAFSSKFSVRGSFHNFMQERAPICQQTFLESIRDCLQTQLDKIGFGNNYGLIDIQQFFQSMDSEIGRVEELCPQRLPELDSLNFSQLYSAENNLWIKMVGLRDQLVSEHKMRLIGEYEESIKKVFKDLRNYFLRPILAELREEIGFTSTPTDGRVTVKIQLERISERLMQVQDQLDETYGLSVTPPKQINVEIIADNQQNDISLDANRLSQEIAVAETAQRLLDQRQMSIFLSQTEVEIADQLKNTYQNISMSRLKGFHVVPKTREMIKSDDAIFQLAQRSDPYQAFTPTYQPLALATPPTLIYGYNPLDNGLNALKQDLDLNNIRFGRVSPSRVEHLLFFYREEAGFALDDLECYGMLKEHFNNYPSQYGYSTHQNPTFYDLVYHAKQIRLERWTFVFTNLLNPISEFLSPAALATLTRFVQSDKYGIYHLFQDANGFEQKVYLTEISEIEHALGVAQLAKYENADAYDKFTMEIRRIFYAIERKVALEMVNRLIEEKVAKTKTPQEEQEIRAYFQESCLSFLDEVFSGEDISPPDSRPKDIGNSQQVSPFLVSFPQSASHGSQSDGSEQKDWSNSGEIIGPEKSGRIRPPSEGDLTSLGITEEELNIIKRHREQNDQSPNPPKQGINPTHTNSQNQHTPSEENHTTVHSNHQIGGLDTLIGKEEEVPEKGESSPPETESPVEETSIDKASEFDTWAQDRDEPVTRETGESPVDNDTLESQEIPRYSVSVSPTTETSESLSNDVEEAPQISEVDPDRSKDSEASVSDQDKDRSLETGTWSADKTNTKEFLAGSSRSQRQQQKTGNSVEETSIDKASEFDTWAQDRDEPVTRETGENPVDNNTLESQEIPRYSVSIPPTTETSESLPNNVEEAPQISEIDPDRSKDSEASVSDQDENKSSETDTWSVDKIDTKGLLAGSRRRQRKT